MEKYRTKTTSLEFEEYINLPKIDMYVNYAKHLKNWIKRYPNKLIKVLVFEDLIRNKRKRLQEISKFLEINPRFYKDFNFEHRNESIAIKYSVIHKLGARLQPFIPHKLQSILLPLYIKWNSKGAISSNEKEKETLIQLKKKYNYIKNELNELNATLPLDLWN